ncbi:DUF6268 family outer membrane beta-barrel protein [Flavobacterium weaverense]|uniref:DUF6268 domain-containing protein n=1 Tax=Flavobacterium weaverense TaxID=271156 RepID=A0A3L9ZYU3_9FLAO|nr:DUF6268 family outer membrane beta-barrel protein [Flavobacterium weaverense]RMA76319.1 hypothetical protein BC961_2047 [Flavobacterium weaverense]
MLKKLLGLIIALLPMISSAQEYVDVITVNYSKTGDTKFKNIDESTSISIFDSKVILPIVINTKTAIITGFDFSIKKLQLFPKEENTNLYYTRLKLGLTTEHSDKWTGTYVLLPVISSDYKNLNSKDVYMGGIAFWTYKKRKTLNYKFGVYTGTEAFGYFITPLIGMYYLSPNSKFEVTALMPGIFDANLALSENFKVGIDYKGISETFKLHDNNHPSTYAENSTLEFSTYVENNSFLKNLLLRLKVGYSANSYEVYNVSDKIDLSLTPIKFGNNRTKLNNNLNSSVLLKAEALYRFDIPANREKK